ncbi:NUDIX hydrolase [Streptomyces sp. ISL-100]|uniref:NUDIX domain-containing protein n=1 Tax=Streptomyces sp. ISL-100 TaxID=2819173 RepID=UPI001BE6ED5B|nr:NUDIX hydrolase [Streptomyces sp. ISL-100]MBT2399348.1 NUDIX hydrolase [Streptomyces sp. ISL-100]
MDLLPIADDAQGSQDRADAPGDPSAPGGTAPAPPRPAVVAKARVLFTDRRGRILLVRLQPWHNALHWGLPGGTVEAGTEAPRQAAVREIAEETGLLCAPGRLLAVDWVNRSGDQPRIVHVFDGGLLEDGDLAGIRLDEAELATWRMCTPDEAEALLSAASWGQLKASLAALPTDGGPAELLDGAAVEFPAP